EQGLAMAQRSGVPYWGILLRQRLAYANFLSGAWDESLQNGIKAIALSRRVGHARDLAHSLAGRAMTLAAQGELSEAAACISEARIVFGGGSSIDRYVLGLVEIVETALALEWGQAERALDIANGLMRSLTLASTPSHLLPAYMPVSLMLLAAAEAAAGDGESALETSRKLIGLGPAGTPYLTALASRAEGLGWHALGRMEAAIACLARAHETFSALEMPFEAARSLLELAISAATERPEPAVKAVQQSLATFEHIGALRYVYRARVLVGELGISATATRRTRLGKVFVTARELEIALLVAQGLRTPEIAGRLVISKRTVTAHLEHVYARLGIRSRADLARCVIEAGLL
ncbi:MAG: LuxR C-terminal-related transcriptional regulator, partial [Dehalococcoidia bacterium]|nr:LuxR C-terminal-related transcriptional regulator [Dehalococcoidia bacterium]